MTSDIEMQRLAIVPRARNRAAAAMEHVASKKKPPKLGGFVGRYLISIQVPRRQ
jgi:hypothetical protein